jgi:predicted dehydrogenase
VGAVRLGLAGAGRWGRNCIRSLAELEHVELAAVASRNVETAALVPEGCAVVPDWSSLLALPGIDGIVVATPAATHAEIAHACIAAGRPVLIEKPLTLSLPSALELKAAVAAHPTLVMVEHTHLFHPAYRALKEKRRSRRIRAIEASAGNQGPYRAEGVLWDWGPHDVAMCLDLMGAEPAGVEAQRLASKRVDGGFAERLRLTLRFPGSVNATIQISNMDEQQRRLAVTLEDEVLVYDGFQPLAPGAQRPLARALAEFAAAIRAGSRSTADLELGVAVVRVLEQCEAELERQTKP